MNEINKILSAKYKHEKYKDIKMLRGVEFNERMKLEFALRDTKNIEASNYLTIIYNNKKKNNELINNESFQELLRAAKNINFFSLNILNIEVYKHDLVSADLFEVFEYLIKTNSENNKQNITNYNYRKVNDNTTEEVYNDYEYYFYINETIDKYDIQHKYFYNALHYYEENFISSMYSVLHEGGHGLYEQNQDETLDTTLLQGGASMGIHESQSRTYENIFGRNYYFLKGIYPKILEFFPELSDVSLDDFYKAVNKPENSLIRIEADELTYSLHVMIRYEIEKLLFEGKIEVEELPKIWNEKIKAYLGIDVPSDSKGVLQDVHWAGGLFGYFPSYSLGNAYASQIVEVMKKDLDLNSLLEKGDFKVINNWLQEKVHKKGLLLDPNDLIGSICKEELNPMPFINYLKDKFENI